MALIDILILHVKLSMYVIASLSQRIVVFYPGAFTFEKNWGLYTPPNMSLTHLAVDTKISGPKNNILNFGDDPHYDLDRATKVYIVWLNVLFSHIGPITPDIMQSWRIYMCV